MQIFVNLAVSSAAHLVSKTFQIWYPTTCSFDRQVAVPGIVTVPVIMATVAIGPKPLHGKHVLVVPKLCSLLFFTDHSQRDLTSSDHALDP